jgi:hypothetical protein
LNIPRFSIALLPRLAEASLPAIIEWRLKVNEVTEQNAPVPQFSLVLIIDPAIWRVVLAASGTKIGAPSEGSANPGIFMDPA